jgi:hypothetical protein
MALGAGQLEAVEAIVGGDGRPVVILGGPGTGKSFAVVEALKELADRPGVVVVQVVPSWNQSRSSEGVFPVATLVYALRGTGRSTPPSLSATVELARKALQVYVFVDEALQLPGATMMDLVKALDGLLGGPRYTQARVRLVCLGDPYQMEPIGGRPFMWHGALLAHPLFARGARVVRLTENFRAAEGARWPEVCSRLTGGGRGDPFVDGFVRGARARWAGMSDTERAVVPLVFVRLTQVEKAVEARARAFMGDLGGPGGGAVFRTVPGPSRRPVSPFCAAFYPTVGPDPAADTVCAVVRVTQPLVGVKVATAGGGLKPLPGGPIQRGTKLTLLTIKLPRGRDYVGADGAGATLLYEPPLVETPAVPPGGSSGRRGRRRRPPPPRIDPAANPTVVCQLFVPAGDDDDDDDDGDEIKTIQFPLWGLDAGGVPTVTVRTCGFGPPGDLFGEVHVSFNVQGQTLDRMEVGADDYDPGATQMLFSRVKEDDGLFIDPEATFDLGRPRAAVDNMAQLDRLGRGPVVPAGVKRAASASASLGPPERRHRGTIKPRRGLAPPA